MRIGTLVELWRFPVKSMAGERVPATFLGGTGIPGDRGWAVYDESRAGITNGKRIPALRTCRARYEREPVVGEAPPPAIITLPDGTEFRSDATDAAARLSAAMGREVSMRVLGATGGPAPPRVSAAGESPDFFREMNGLLPGEPMPDMSELPIERLRELREGNFFDAFTVHLITRTSIATLAGLAPESDWHESRFRANFLVEMAGATGYPELGWVRRRVRIGSAVIDVAMGCPRCVMVTQATETLPADPRIMRTLVRETHHTAGIYATVVEPGDVREGDSIELLDERVEAPVPSGS